MARVLWTKLRRKRGIENDGRWRRSQGKLWKIGLIVGNRPSESICGGSGYAWALNTDKCDGEIRQQKLDMKYTDRELFLSSCSFVSSPSRLCNLNSF